MKPAFPHDFLLTSPRAVKLYTEFAEGRPIYDYHSHLRAGDLLVDRTAESITQLWLAPDPYKHRAMRIAGVPERLITGSATDEEKFHAWASTVPQTAGNALHVWTALELKRAFGVDEPLNQASAGRLWARLNEALRSSELSPRQLLRRSAVAAIATSEKLSLSVDDHRAAAARDNAMRVVPTWRADELMEVESDAFERAILELGKAAGGEIHHYDDLRQTLTHLAGIFAAAGCRLSDVAVNGFDFLPVSEEATATFFDRRVGGESLTTAEVCALRSGLLTLVARISKEQGWTLQLHLGAQRKTSSRLSGLVGANGGYATIGDPIKISDLCALLDAWEQQDALPKLIIYPLNLHDYEAIANLAGSFTGDGVAGNLTLGPAWWFHDNRDGIRAQLSASANYGLLACMPGMVTDSRSVLSIYRHEYFRRLLCDWLADRIAAHDFPDDPEQIERVVTAILVENPRRYFL